MRQSHGNLRNFEANTQSYEKVPQVKIQIIYSVKSQTALQVGTR